MVRPAPPTYVVVLKPTIGLRCSTSAKAPEGRVNTYSKEKQDWSRIDGIDLMRGLSIFFVLMNHVNMRLLGAKVPYLKGVAFRIIWRSVSEIFGVVSDLL
jgi:hypothetical protein